MIRSLSSVESTYTENFDFIDNQDRLKTFLATITLYLSLRITALVRSKSLTICVQTFQT